MFKKKVETFHHWKYLHNEVKIQNQNLWDAVPKGKIIAYTFILEKSLVINLNKSSEKDKSWGTCTWKWQWRK